MKKNEAKKVLDFLCRRWSQRVVDVYREQMDLHCMIEFSRRRWFLDGGNICLDFKYTWPRKKNEHTWIQPQNVRLCARYDVCNGFCKPYMRPNIIWIPFEEESRMKSNHDILDFLFNFKDNPDVFVEGFSNEHTHFIDADESFEEVLVKADLEDFDDRE